MSNENNNPGNIEDARWKAYVQSVSTGTKYLRSAWHNNVKPNETSENKTKVGLVEHKGSEANSPRKNSSLDDLVEYKGRSHTKDKKNGSKSNSHKVKLKHKDFSSKECIQTPMDLINSIGPEDDEQSDNKGKITSYFKKKSSLINNTTVYNETACTPNQLQNSNSKNEVKDSSNIVSKLDSNKKNKKLSIHNSILPYEIVPDADSNLCNPYLYSISLDEKIRDNRRSVIENYKGRCVAVKRKKAEGDGWFLFGRLESINQLEETIEVIFFDQNIMDSELKEIMYKDKEVYLLEYMFSYLEENDFDSAKVYFIATSKFDSIFYHKEVDANHCKESTRYYNGFLVGHGFILREIKKISSTNLNVIQEADIVDNLTAKYFKLINKNLIFFIDHSEFLEVFTNKMRSISYSSVEPHKITTKADCLKNYDLLSNYVLHEIILTMNINHKTDRRIGILLSVNKGPNYESIYLKNYKTGKSQWIYLNDYKLSIRANISKSRVVIDTLFNLGRADENFYKFLKFSYQTSCLTSTSTANYDRIVLKKFTQGINIMKEMECHKCTYKIGEFEYRMCKICKKISHIGCLASTDSIKDNIHGSDYWYCKSCKPCRICLSNIADQTSFAKRTCSTCSQCYHQECLNDYIVPLYPVNPVEESWKCENCLKCVNCDISAMEIVNNYFHNKTPPVHNSAHNNPSSPAQTNLMQTNSITYLKSNKFSNNFNHCENCEKKYYQKEYCPVCRKLWQATDVNMIECKCKYWVHEECDRIFSNDYFQKIKKKNYNCPKCRTEKKNQQIFSIIEELTKLDKLGYFYNAVDTSSLKNYTKIIKKPMCYAFILEKLEKNIYLNNMDELFSDVYLIFFNAMTFNMPNSQVYKIAEQLNLNSNQFLEKYYPILYELSFEYFLFDFNPEETGENSKNILLILEAMINNNFSKQVGLLKSKISQIVAKINEYKINWQFLKEFMEKNFNCVYIKDFFQILSDKENINNVEKNNFNSVSYSVISETENIFDKENYQSSINKVDSSSNTAVMFKSAFYEEKTAVNNINYISSDSPVNDINMQIDYIEEQCQVTNIAETQQLVQKYSIEKDCEYAGDNYLKENTQDNEAMLIDAQYQKQNSEISMKNQAQVQTVLKSTLHRIDLALIKEEAENDTNNLKNIKLEILSNGNVAQEITEILPYEDFKNKKRQRTKPKLTKSSEFQHELDTYNSNFELAVKSNNKITTGNNSNLNHKMEISECSVDVFNPSIALEEEEDIAIKAYEKSKLTDTKLQFLYFNKYKNYIEQLDNPNEFSDYLDMIMCYVNIKEEKKKKNSIDKEKIAKLKYEAYNENNSCYSDDIYEEPKRNARIKKSRQIKKEMEDSNEIVINTENLNSRERKKSNAKEVHNKFNFNSNLNIAANKGHEITTKKPHSNNLNKHPNPADPTQCKLNIDNMSRCKSESELFDESINQKSILPLPTQICFSFSRVDLIFEKNCYLCGSFDDTNQFLSCSVCFENFHSYCISNSPLITSNIENIKKYNWKCQNCKFCECCKQTGNDLLLLYCDSCDRAVHTYCLDSKLHVVPESGWKCLSCFKCVNCHSEKYYQPTFPINPAKDYSVFTKNFHYCFECGMKLFHKSMCVKCGKSDFKNCDKDVIYVSNAADWEKYQNKLITDNDNNNSALGVYQEKNVVMLNCNICNYMFHWNCLGFDENNLKLYFDQFDKFNCIDCHYKQKCKDKYLEATFIQYLEVLKMSFFLMSFNKLINIMLKTICKDSNIKLHSKLLKIFLKDNFESFMQDRRMCMLLELIRMDVFLMKDKQALFDENPRKAKTANDPINTTNNSNVYNIPDSQSALKMASAIEINPRQEKAKSNPFAFAIHKTIKKNKEIKQNMLRIENENFYGYSMDKMEKSSLPYSERNDFAVGSSNLNIPDTNFNNELLILSQHTAEENFVSNLEEIEKSVIVEQLRNVKLDFYHSCRILRKHSLENLRQFNRMINKNKLIYNINASNSKHSFSLDKKFLSKNVDYDSSNNLVRSMTMLKRRNQSKYDCNMTGLIANNLFSSDITNNVTMTNQEDIMVVDSVENLKDSANERKNIDAEKEDKINQSNLSHMLIEEKKIMDSGSADQKNKRQRITLVPDKELKRDLKNFFNQENRKEIENSNTTMNDDTNFINFYNFNIEEYYKGRKCQVGKDNKSISSEEKEMLDKTLEKLNMMLRLQTFPKHMQMFVFNIILDAIFTLRQRLVKWLLNQMLIISENPQSFPNKTSNSLYSYLINLNLASAALNPEFESINNNALDCTDEEITKFLDHIDPLQDSPNRSSSCEFCLRKGARKFSGRLLYIRNEHWAHVNCILWSKGVQEANDGNIFNVSQAVNKLRQLKCQFCRKYGATICCDSKKCGKYFHFACAHAKHSVFTDKRQFFCGKCATNALNKEESFADFNTNKRYFIVRNQEFMNDYKSFANYSYVNQQDSPNGFKLIPKYLIGAFNKFGNTTVMKFFQMNQKDMNLESIDIAVVKYFEKSEKNLTKDTAEEILLLYVLNENGISFSQLCFSKENWKDFEDLIERAKITNCFAKSDIDLNQLRDNSKYEILSKNFNGQYNLNLNNSTYTGANAKTERLDFFNNQIIKRLNINIEEFMTSNILTEEEIKSSKRINKRYNDWLSVMNISIPFNIILKYRTLYLKTLTELSESLTTSTLSGEMLPDIKNKKEIKNKLENFLSTIKTKNSIADKQCFRFLNYMETHQQIKFVKKSLIDNELNNEASKTGEKKVNKANKQTYKNLNRTMSTNIMEMDLPLAMKFRNYKALRPRVTIGPSTIHRNGLFTTEAFQPGEIVIEYVGELITNKIADFREKEYNLKGFGDCYMFRLDGDHIIDATKYGNLARFINHCCNPNCSAQANQIGDKKHIILYAKRPIKAHEEITYDYNFECEQEKIQCRCGAINCQGRLN